MGKRLVIKGASFINIVDTEASYKEKTYNSTNIEFVGGGSVLGLGGFGTAETPYWTNNVSSAQLGCHFPIAVDGATEIVIKKSYGQPNGIHAKFLAEDGSWIADVIGGVSRTDASITPTIPSNAKWLIVNFYESGYEVTVKGYMTDITNTITPTLNTAQAFIGTNGSITNSTTAGVYAKLRSVYDIDVSGKSAVYLNGFSGTSGGQAYCIGCLFDASNNMIGNAIIADTQTNCTGMVKISIPANAIRLSVNGFENIPPQVKY